METEADQLVELVHSLEQQRKDLAEELAAVKQQRDDANERAGRAADRLEVMHKATDEHCKDCCCARSWRALGVTMHTGRSIPEHIDLLRAERDALVALVRDSQGRFVTYLAWHRTMEEVKEITRPR